MDNKQYNFDFSFLKSSVWITVILAILKLSGAVNIENIWIFIPIIIAAVLVFLIIFFIGLCVVYLYSKGKLDIEKDNENEDNEKE